MPTVPCPEDNLKKQIMKLTSFNRDHESDFLLCYLGIWRKHDLREVMLREVVGTKGLLLGEDVVRLEELSSTSTEAVEKTVRLSPADFLGEPKRLSGRICSKLLK
jgi:hypothetical protein